MLPDFKAHAFNEAQKGKEHKSVVRDAAQRHLRAVSELSDLIAA